MSDQCSICSNRAARDVIDGALLAGETPAEVVRLYAEDLHVSRSSVYRHARHRALPTLSPSYLGNEPVGEVVSDAAQLARSLFAEYRRALEAGQSAQAARFGHEANLSFLNLLRLGIDSEEFAERFVGYERIANVFVAFLSQNREQIPSAARAQGFYDVADDIENLADRFTAHDAERTRRAAEPKKPERDYYAEGQARRAAMGKTPMKENR